MKLEVFDLGSYALCAGRKIRLLQKSIVHFNSHEQSELTPILTPPFTPLFFHGTKIRLSEQNAKEKFIFLFILEREYLRDEVAKLRLSERKTK